MQFHGNPRNRLDYVSPRRTPPQTAMIKSSPRSFSHRRQQRNSRTHVQCERVVFQQETLVPSSSGGQIRAVCAHTSNQLAKGMRIATRTYHLEACMPEKDNVTHFPHSCSPTIPKHGTGAVKTIDIAKPPTGETPLRTFLPRLFPLCLSKLAAALASRTITLSSLIIPVTRRAALRENFDNLE